MVATHSEPSECVDAVLPLCLQLANGSHVELPCNEVGAEEREAVVGALRNSAEQYFQAVLASPNSFNKPTFYLVRGVLEA